jgi:nucleotide-binding universal stress UspA family protein
MEASSRSGPVLIAYDGSDAARRAIRESGRLLSGRSAIVITVYKQGVGFEAAELPTMTLGLPPAPLDVRTAMEIEEEIYEGARKRAQEGADLANESGFEAEGMAVADDIDTPVAETIVDLARERDAPAIVLGAHGHGPILTILGSTSRDVVRSAECSVLLTRAI